MRITPKLALTTTAVLVAIGLLWVGFLEGGRGQTTINQGSGSQGPAVAAQYHHQFVNQYIAAELMPAPAVPEFADTGASPAALQPQDNVPALALSGTVIAALVMLSLAFARFQAVHPAVHAETATPRRTHLVASGPSQL